MSFIGVVEQNLEAAEQAAVAAAKDLVSYIDNVVVVDLIPELEVVLKNGIQQLGQAALAALLNSSLGKPSTTAST